MRAAVVLLLLVGCGRFGFDAQPGDGDGGTAGDVGDGGGGGDAGDDTGPSGPRWVKRFGPPNNLGLAGRGGEVIASTSFSSTFTGDGVSLTGMGSLSTAFARFGVDGTVKDTRVFDGEFFCDLRVAVFDGDAVVLGGFSAGGAMSALGTCSVSTVSQDPIVIRIAGDGTESVMSHWAASGTNAQLWRMARYGSGKLIVGGVYSDGLMIDAALPMAQADPNMFLAQPLLADPASGAWSKALVSNNVVYPGPMDTVDSRGYLIGGFAASSTLLGTPLTTQGGIDAFVARVDDDGVVGFVKAIGSPANEPDYGSDQSVAALTSGGVAITTRADDDITFDGQPFAVSDGPTLLLVLDGSGALQYGKRLPADSRVVAVADTLYAAFTVGAPYDVNGNTHTPMGNDVLIVKLGASGAPASIVGVVGGAGDQYVTDLVEIGTDALAITGGTTGALTFGSTSFSTGVETRFIASLGL